MATLMNTGEIGSQQDPDFFQDDNDIPKKIKKKTAKSNYSNTKVKARNLLTNVSYRRYKQKDSNNANFITDILSFLVQNFTPINLDRKLDNENEKFFIKFLWDECLPHGFTRFICMGENYNVLSNPKLTYQKANGIVKKFIKANTNNINLLKFKIEENFKIIQYVYSLLHPKIYNRINNFGIQNKSNFDFAFSNWRTRKQNGAISPKIINELPAPTKQLMVTEMLSKRKNPKDYQGRELNEYEQAPITPSPKLTAETVEIKKEIVSAKRNNFDKTDGSAK